MGTGRRGWLATCAALLVPLGAPLARAGDPRPEPAAVEAAVARARDWLGRDLAATLARLQAGNKSEPYARGQVALAVFALLRCGVAPEQLSAAFDYLRRSPPDGTYSEACAVLALGAVGVKVKLGEDQGRSYERRRVPAAVKQWMQPPLEALLRLRNQGRGSWGYRGGGAAGGYDNSNTQYAVYALHAAEDAGLELPVGVWQEVLAHFLEDQVGAAAATAPVALGDTRLLQSLAAPGGGSRRGGTRERGAARVFDSLGRELQGTAAPRGWPYAAPVAAAGAPPSSPAASQTMTPAGLGSLAMAVEALARRRALPAKVEAQAREAIRDGLAWMVGHWSSSTLAGTGALNLYEYYAVEKALDALGVECLAGADWWGLGAARLLATQNESGGWGSDQSELDYQVRVRAVDGGSRVATAFALLFLTRATLPADGSEPPARRPPPRVITGQD